jgi:hypothetical protein|tara:strand:- start:471 stop:704 length:234 start_codon:yes stop_codon:yes gene_type:complete
MLTARGEDIFVDLKAISTMKPDIVFSKREAKNVNMTIIEVSGGQRHFILLPPFEELLQAVTAIKTDAPPPTALLKLH